MVYIVKTHWAGLSGGPGITQLAIDAVPAGGFITAADAQVVVNAVRKFWLDQNGLLPNDLTLTTDAAIDSFDAVSGTLGATITAATPPSPVVGTTTGSFSMASGYKINILTTGIRNNRRVKGSIFMVPADYNAYDSSGRITGSVVTTVATATSALVTSLATVNLKLGVWSRPKPFKTGNNGQFYPMTGTSTSSKVAILRGRRG